MRKKNILEIHSVHFPADGWELDLQFSEKKNIKLIILMTAGQQQSSVAKHKLLSRGV